MTDADLVRHLAEKVMGWNLGGIPIGIMAHTPEGPVDLSGGRTDHPIWNPLTDARALEQVEEALRAKLGWKIVICLDCDTWHATIYPEGGIFSQSHQSKKRAFCLAAVRATGGEV